MEIVPITDLQQNTRKYIKKVKDTGVPIYVTQRGRAAVVVMPADQYDGYLATVDEMSYPDWRERLERADRDLKSGKGVELKEYLKKRAKRRRRG